MSPADESLRDPQAPPRADWVPGVPEVPPLHWHAPESRWPGREVGRLLLAYAAIVGVAVAAMFLLAGRAS